MPTHARFLIVADDDRLVRETLCDLLEPFGFAARQAADGASAIRELGRGRCDLLLSDVDMPDMTGFQVLDWARAHPPTPATVLMSARADADLGYPRASVVAELAWAMHLAGRHTPPEQLEPLYVRRPAPEEVWERRQRGGR